jgi:hypothetical protein
MGHVGSYQSCPRCGLSIELRSAWLAVQHCPRCVARAHTTVAMVSSGPADETAQTADGATGSLMREAGRP